MNKLKYFVFSPFNYPGSFFLNMKNHYSTNAGKSSQTQTISGIFSKIKNMFLGSSAPILNDQIQQTRSFNDSILKTPIIQLPSLNLTTSAIKRSDENLKDEQVFEKVKYIKLPTKHKDAGFRKTWGVKLTEDSMNEPILNEHMPNYILKQKWGVKLWEAVNLTEESSAKKVPAIPQIPVRQIESSDLTSMLEKQFMDSLENDGIKMKSENPPPIIDSSISVVPPIGEEVDPLKPMNEETNLLMEKKPTENSMNTETHDIIEDIYKNDELTAWKEVTDRTNVRTQQMENVELQRIKEEQFDTKFSIIPEPPTPKVDVAAVKPLDTNLHEASTVFDNKNTIGQVDAKKFHTQSFLFLCYSVKNFGESEISDKSSDSDSLEMIDIPSEHSEDFFEEGTDDNEEESTAFLEDTDETWEQVHMQHVEKQDTSHVIEENHENYEQKSVNDDYVRIPGDPYPFTRKYFEQWQMRS